MRDNEAAARACGVDVLRTKLAGMAVSAALTGAGGTLFVMYLRIVDPPTVLTLSEVGLKLALIVLIGGGRRVLWGWRARKAVARL